MLKITEVFKDEILFDTKIINYKKLGGGPILLKRVPKPTHSVDLKKHINTSGPPPKTCKR